MGIGKVIGYAAKGAVKVAKKVLSRGAKEAETVVAKTATTPAKQTGRVGGKFNYSLFDSNGKTVMHSSSTPYTSGGYTPTTKFREGITSIPHGEDTRIITTKSSMGTQRGAYEAKTTIDYSVLDAEGFSHPEGKAVVTRTGLHDDDCVIKFFDRFGKEIESSPVANWFTDIGKAMNK